MPHDPSLDRILADSGLSPTAKLIAVALVKNWAWVKDHCWPSDRTIAGKVGKSPGHVQRCLRELEAAGWIRRERTDAVRSGRRIWLVWRCADGAGAQQSPALARVDTPAPARSERVVIVKEGMEPEDPRIGIPKRLRAEQGSNAVLQPEPVAISEPTSELPPVTIAVAPPAEPPHHLSIPEEVAPALEPPGISIAPPTALPASVPAIPLTPAQQTRLAELAPAMRDEVLTWLATGDPILAAEARKRLTPMANRSEAPRTLSEVLKRIREDPSYPSLAASGLARVLEDQKSYAGFLARCTEAWRGELPVERLEAAYQQAMGPKAKRPGALFMHAIGQGGQ